MSRRWLLMLGSNVDERSLQSGVEALAALGPTVALGEVLRNPDRDGGADYFNRLVVLQTALGLDDLKVALAGIELALGRRRDGSGEVALDIDPIAFETQDGWQAETRALAKGEFDRPPLPELLASVGIVVSRRAGPG